MAVDGISSELFSVSNSLLTGKNIGKFLIFLLIFACLILQDLDSSRVLTQVF